MTTLLNRIFISPLSAVIALAGDVLIATVAAISVATGQFILLLSSHRRPDAVLLLSVVLIVALGVIALSGQDAAAAAGWSPVNAMCETSHCACTARFLAI